MLSNFYTDVICKDHRFNSPQACADVGLLEPITRSAIIAIIHDASKMGHKLVPVETYRSQARQTYFYQKHLTKLRNVGTHHFGLACDLALIADGKSDPHGEDYLFLRTLAEEHGLISGCDWGQPSIAHSFRDYDHLQRVPISRQAALFAGTWYPDPGYHPFPDLHRTEVTAFEAPLIHAIA